MPGTRRTSAVGASPGVKAMHQRERRHEQVERSAVSLLVTAVAVTVLSLAPAPVGAVALATTPNAVTAAGVPAVKVPSTPVGKQLDWLLGIGPRLPLSTKEISAHFDCRVPRTGEPAPS